MADSIGEAHAYGVDTKNREIYLHGYHGSFEEDPGVDYRMATTFIKNIRTLETLSNQSVIIHMHSIGGNWADGMAIYDAISSCKSHITILAYGQAESMSSIILQSADLRIMMPHSYFMLHFGSSLREGDYLSCQNYSKFEQKMESTMVGIYAAPAMEGKFFQERYTPITQGKVQQYIRKKMKDGDWYLDSHEAVYHGLADGVLNSRKYPSIQSIKQSLESS